MGLYEWRLRISLEAAQQAASARPVAQEWRRSLIARVRNVLAPMRKISCPSYLDLVPVRLPLKRPHD
jgi:hypothetical protein